MFDETGLMGLEHSEGTDGFGEAREMTYREDMVQCIYCHEFQPLELMTSVFRTGFVQHKGVSYPLGVCGTCSEIMHQSASRPADSLTSGSDGNGQ